MISTLAQKTNGTDHLVDKQSKRLFRPVASLNFWASYFPSTRWEDRVDAFFTTSKAYARLRCSSDRTTIGSYFLALRTVRDASGVHVLFPVLQAETFKGSVDSVWLIAEIVSLKD